MKLFLYYFLIINAFSFLLFGIDKFLAKKNKRRVPEKELFTVSLLGGALGGLFAMLVFKHKIAKFSFLWKFIFILLLNVIGIFFMLK